MENYIFFAISIIFGLILKLTPRKKLETTLNLFFNSQPFKKGFLLLNLALILLTSYYGMLLFSVLLIKGNSILISSIAPLFFILATVNVAYRSVLLVND